MHVHIGFLEFLVFCLYYIILKALIMFIHLELRRNNAKTGAAVTGLIS